jgi:HK97 family phage portal protein
MGFLDYLRSVFKSKTEPHGTVYKGFVGSSPNINVYEASVVRACIHAIAEECSKMVIKSVKVKNGIVTENKDDINRLFKGKPNPVMTLKDMLYWTAYQLEVRENAYWFPHYRQYDYGDGGIITKLESIFPINSESEDMIFDEKTNSYMIVFKIVNGGIYSVPYEDVIHFRKHYGDDYYFGRENRSDLLKKLKIYDQVTTLMPKALETSMQLKGVLSAKSQMGKDALDQFKEEFIKNLSTGNGAFATLGADGHFEPMNISSQIVDEKVLEHLEKTALMNFGVSMKILTGDATENEWQTLYSKNIESFKIAIEQAATHVLFKHIGRQHDNEIKVYDKLVQHYTIKTRLEMIKNLGPQNYLSRAEQRELAGYEPDGGVDRVSLNFVSKEIIDAYQLKNKVSLNEEDNDDTGQ